MIRETPDKFMLRLPEGLRNRIKEAAERNFRSMNAEIVFHLNRTYAEAETKKADAAA